MNAETCRKYLDGELGADEFRALAQTLRADSERRNDFVAQLMEEAMFVAAAESLAVALQTAPTQDIAPPVKALRLGRWLPALAAAAVLAAAAGLWLVNEARRSAERGDKRSPVAKVLRTNPECRMRNAAGRRVSLNPGDEVCEGARIDTRKNGMVELAYIGLPVTVELGENAKYEVRTARSDYLETGSLVAAVAAPTASPRTAQADRFVVCTPHAKAEVVGTIFGLHVTANRSRLDVEQGVVKFTGTAKGDSVDVAPQQTALARDGQTVVRSPRPRDMKYMDGAVLFRDDFERTSGNFLDGWGITFWTKDPAAGEITMREPTPGMLSASVSVGPGDRAGGHASRAVMLDFEALRAVCPEIAVVFIHMDVGLRELAEKGPLSVEFDLWMEQDSHISFVIGKEYGGTKKTPTLNPLESDAPVRRSEGQFCPERIEIYPRTGSAGRRSFEFRRYRGGRKVQTITHDYEDFMIGCGLTKGTSKLDNIVVRRMVPAAEDGN